MSNKNFVLNSTDGTYVNDITFTTSTASDVTSTINLSDYQSVWFPYYMESTWLPYHYTPYKPEWHITQGYKNQIKNMWNV